MRNRKADVWLNIFASRSVKFGIIGCSGCLAILIFWIAKRVLYGPPGIEEMRTAPHFSPLGLLWIAFFLLWIYGSLAGLIGGKLSQSSTGKNAFDRSIILACLLPLVYFLLLIMPKS